MTRSVIETKNSLTTAVVFDDIVGDIRFEIVGGALSRLAFARRLRLPVPNSVGVVMERLTKQWDHLRRPS